jgi:hypothetical protein
MVLAGDRLVYYDDICSQYDLTGTIMASDVTSVEEDMEGDKLIIRINFRSNDKKQPIDDWRIHLGDESLHKTWLWKIRFVVSQAQNMSQISHVNPILAAGRK